MIQKQGLGQGLYLVPQLCNYISLETSIALFFLTGRIIVRINWIGIKVGCPATLSKGRVEREVVHKTHCFTPIAFSSLKKRGSYSHLRT